MNDASRPGRMEWLQALRGIAALMVLGFHAQPFLDANVPDLKPWIAPARWGFSGVEVFFALSGFVVFRAARRARSGGRLRDFVRHRFIRIYLGYWPALVVLALAGWLVVDEPLPDAPNLFRSIFLIQSTLTKHWLHPAWSLEYELYFYVVAAGLVFAAPRRPALGVSLVLLVLIGWNVGCMVVVPGLVFSGRQPLDFLLTGHAIVFFAGALVAVACDGLREQRVTPGLPVALGALAFVVLCGNMGVMSQAMYNPTLRATTFGLMALGLLVACIALEEAPLRPPRWLVRVGDASFGLYVLHTPLLTVFYTWLGDARSMASIPIGVGTAAAVAVPLAVVLVSLQWFRWVEDPLHRYGLRALGGNARQRDGLGRIDATAAAPQA